MDESSPHRAVSSDPDKTMTSSPSPHKMAAKQQDESSNSETAEPVQVGGETETSAFALLDGVVYGKNLKSTANCVRIRVPITRLPATLGRSHETSDESFFGLTAIKALSREQCRLYYQEPNGGRFTLRDDKFVYEPAPKGEKKPDVILLDPDKPLPTEGFFVIECVGKNKITVGKNRVEQGQLAELESGTPIRMSSLCLFFLLPTDNKRVTMDIPDPTASPTAKRKRAPNNDGPDAKRQSSSGGNVAMLQELEQLSSEELLAEMRESVVSGLWERRQQLLGGLIAYHAVKDASQSKAIRKIEREDGGASRKQIIDWMAASPKYAFWVTHTLNRVEISSFQSTVSRVLLKAGYERLGKNGRYVKWKLPPSAEKESEKSDDDVESDAGGESNNGSEGNAFDNNVKLEDADKEEDEDNGDDDDNNEEDDDGHDDDNNEEEVDDDDDDDDDNEDENEHDRAIAAESKEEASDDGNDSSDEDEEESSRPATSKMDDPVKEDDSNGDNDAASSDSSVDEEEEDILAASMASQEMDDAAKSDEGSVSSSGNDGEVDDTMSDAEQAMSSD